MTALRLVRRSGGFYDVYLGERKIACAVATADEWTVRLVHPSGKPMRFAFTAPTRREALALFENWWTQ